jgi:NAD(P)-dependent dehydrogenase (short-subunit alcohol dehydrogenase family)
VEDFARQFQALNLPLNMLINNAGIMNTPYGLTVDGFEQQMGTNHMGHFYLTKLLLPQLYAAGSLAQPSRVVNVASMAHKFADMTVENVAATLRPSSSKGYNGWKAYGNSKLANVLFARSLQAKHAANGVQAFSLHPGVVATELGRTHWVTRFMYSAGAMFMKTSEEGAGTSIYCATHPSASLHAGGYFDRCEYSLTATKLALDDALAEALYVKSEEELAAWQARRDNAKQQGQEQKEAQQEEAAPGGAQEGAQ